MSMTITEAANDVVRQFDELPTWEDRYARLITFGKYLAPYPDEHRTETYKVKGCQSQVWLHPAFEGGKVRFEADSDSTIAKGIISLLLFVYNDRSPQEILATKPDFLDRIGLAQALSPNRANGLAAMLKQIQLYALALSRRTA